MEIKIKTYLKSDNINIFDFPNKILMRFFKKLFLFFTYRSTLNSIEKELRLEYNARIDSIYRIYTVLNLPDVLFEEPYNFKTSDIDQIARNYILDFRKKFSDFLVRKGLLELFDLYEIRKVDKYSYLLIFGFSLFNTKKVANSFIMTLILLGIIGIVVIFGVIIFNFIG